MGTMGSGVTFGVTSWIEMCRDCGYQGQPILFDSEQEYQKFLEKLRRKPHKRTTTPKEEPFVEETEDERIELPQKDKEVVNLLKDYEKEKVRKPVWPKNKVWWPEISLALALAIWAYFSGLANLASLMGIEIAIFYGILNLITNFFVFLFGIVIIEYFLRSILNVLRK
jgi:hypothetical protein